jgi:hypothetical protein
MKTYSMRIEKENVPSGLKIKKTNRRNFLILENDKGDEALVSYRSLVALRVGSEVLINKAYTEPYANGKGVKACSLTTRRHLSIFNIRALDRFLVDKERFSKVARKMHPSLELAYNVDGSY